MKDAEKRWKVVVVVVVVAVVSDAPEVVAVVFRERRLRQKERKLAQSVAGRKFKTWRLVSVSKKTPNIGGIASLSSQHNNKKQMPINYKT